MQIITLVLLSWENTISFMSLLMSLVLQAAHPFVKPYSF